jgi:hypothetical protein
MAPCSFKDQHEPPAFLADGRMARTIWQTHKSSRHAPMDERGRCESGPHRNRSQAGFTAANGSLATVLTSRLSFFRRRNFLEQFSIEIHIDIAIDQ